MENIVIVEKLCEALQNSDRPTDLGVAIALRVVLDENIVLEEMRANANEHYRTTLKTLTDSAKTRVELLRENIQLKKLNAELEVKLETANALVNLMKCQKLTVTTVKPEQEALDFLKEERERADKMHSVYYQSAKKRARRIWAAVEAKQRISINDFKLISAHIVNWNTTFNLMWEEPLQYEHVEAACMPKCYGGLGLLIGMKLEKLLFKK